MKKKVLLSSIVAIALCVSLIAGASFALFTSEYKVNAAVNAGDVDVTATVVDAPVLGSTLGENVKETSVDFSGNLVTLNQFIPGDYVTFNIVISNKSDITVKYRTVISVVEDNGLWDGLTVTIDGKDYDGSTVRAAWEVLAPGSADRIVPVKISLPEIAGNEYKKTSCTLSYTVEAIQGNVNTDQVPDSGAELDDLLASGSDAVLNSDLSFSANDTSANSGYGATGVRVNGTTLDGQGHTLTVSNANSTWDCAVSTSGGTIKNLTVNGAFRGIFMSNLTSDLYIDNVVIDEVCYTMHADGNTRSPYSVFVTNSTFNGWTSYSDIFQLVSFTNCTFGKGTGGYKYAYMRPYNATVLTNCTFMEGFEIDPRNNVTLDNCYYGDTLITSENIDSFGLIVGDMAKVSVVDYTVVDGVYHAYTNAGMDDAIKDGATTVQLGSGNYIIPDSAQGKTLSIVGNGVDTVVATQDDGSYEGCDYSLEGATVTFEGITINTDSSTYTGYARMNATYNNCTINGQYTLYGESRFNDCTFNVSGDAYNIWTWGGEKVEFNNCTFNSDGKSILVYNQTCDVYVNGCTFNDRTNGTGFTKSALETGVDGVGAATYNIYINDTTVNGFAKNDKCVGYENIVGNKNSMTNEYLNIVIDGTDVY